MLQKCNYKALTSALLVLFYDLICLFSYILVLTKFIMLCVDFELKWDDFGCNLIIGFKRWLSRYKLLKLWYKQLKHAELKLWKPISHEPERLSGPIIHRFHITFRALQLS